MESPNTPSLPGPDLACNAQAILKQFIYKIEIAIFVREVAPGQANDSRGSET